MALDTSLITKLRESTGAGLIDCKTALDEAGNDLQKAVEILRKKGAVKAAKKIAERTTHEGVVDSYIHATGKVGVLIQVGCETDFVANNSDFKALVHDLAIQIAGANAQYVRPEDVPADIVGKEKEIYREQLANEKKPEAMWDKIIEGKLAKFYQEACLLKQPFIKDDSMVIEQMIQAGIAKLGEKIEVVRFSRFQV